MTKLRVRAFPLFTILFVAACYWYIHGKIHPDHWIMAVVHWGIVISIPIQLLTLFERVPVSAPRKPIDWEKVLKIVLFVPPLYGFFYYSTKSGFATFDPETMSESETWFMIGFNTAMYYMAYVVSLYIILSVLQTIMTGASLGRMWFNDAVNTAKDHPVITGLLIHSAWKSMSK